MSYNKIMNSDEYYGYEDRNYINPTMSRDEQLSFVDNLRKTQDRANTDIETQTHGLGMQIPSRKGGLNAFSTQLNTTGTGGPLLDENGVAKTNPDSFFNKRYQTPQLDSQVAALKSAAQASALNNILANEQAQYKKRYNEAYKAAKKRAAANANKSVDPETYAPPEVTETPVEIDDFTKKQATFARLNGGILNTDLIKDYADDSMLNGSAGSNTYKDKFIDHSSAPGFQSHSYKQEFVDDQGNIWTNY